MLGKMRLQIPGTRSEILALQHACEEPDMPSFIDCEKQGQNWESLNELGQHCPLSEVLSKDKTTKWCMDFVFGTSYFVRVSIKPYKTI